MKFSSNFDALKAYINNYVTLNEAEWELIIPYLKIRVFNKNEIVQEIGKEITCFHFIQSGALRLYTIYNNKEITYRVYNKLHFITDIIGLKERKPSTCCLESLVKSTIISIESTNAEKLFSISPNYDKFARILYENLLYKEIDIIRKELIASAKEKYFTFMKENKEILSELTQSKIAVCINLSPETLSRIKRDLIKVNL